MVGIGITEYNRPAVFKKSYEQIKKYAPKGAKIVVVDDGSDKPLKEATFRFEQNVGIAKAKNKCLELLKDCDDIFLFDSDTYPTDKDWHKPYIASPQPHLMYNFQSSPGHWAITCINQTDDLKIYNSPRGCMLYVNTKVLQTVGGLHVAFGKHGFEHEDWSRRIHDAGLTSYLFADVANPKIYCLDQDETISSINYSNHTIWRRVNRQRLPEYAEYIDSPIPVMVARRYDNDHRDKLWELLKDIYWDKLPYKIYEGYHTEGKFNRSAGLNKAARQAGNWDVGVFIDSDVWCEPANIAKAVEIARQTGKLVSVLTAVHELDEQSTNKILKTRKLTGKHTYENVRTSELSIQSNIIVVPRALFEAVRGFDEQFVGWGGEDNAFWKSCQIIAGPPIRIDDNVYHLWHKTADKSNAPRNHNRWFKYNRAKTERDLKWLLGI